MFGRRMRKFDYAGQALTRRRLRVAFSAPAVPPSDIPGANTVTLGTPYSPASGRITTTPDLQTGWILAWGGVAGSGSVTVNADGTFTADTGVDAFQVQVYDGSSWGAVEWVLIGDATIADPTDQAQTNCALSATITFTPFTPTGGTVGVISVDVGEYKLGSGAWTSAEGVWAGEEITTRHTSSGSFNTGVVQTLTVADQTVTFTSTTAPALAFSVQPIAASLGATSTRVQFTVAGKNDITYAVVVLADGATAPSAPDVLAGTVAGAVASLTGQTAANGVVELSSLLSGLTAETLYDVYVAIDDSESSVVVSTRLDITTDAEAAYTPDSNYSNQGNQQGAFRALALTTETYNGDFIAAMRADLADDTGSINELMIKWLQQKLGSSNQSLPGLMAEAANDRGVERWQEITNPLAIGT